MAQLEAEDWLRKRRRCREPGSDGAADASALPAAASARCRLARAAGRPANRARACAPACPSRDRPGGWRSPRDASSNSSLHCRSATRTGNTPRPFGVSTIFLIGAAVGGGRGCQDALVDQRAQPHREDVFRKSQLLLEFAEAADAEQRVADDQERPPVADRSSARAIGQSSPLEARPFHHRLVSRIARRSLEITALCGCIIKPDALARQHSLIMQPHGGGWS